MAIPATIRWEGDERGHLLALDQTRLPAEVVEVRLDTVDSVVEAIRRLVVRGAPLIGIAAAYGMAVAARDLPDHLPPAEAAAALRSARALLLAARPTAVNLRRALERADAAIPRPPRPPAELRRLLLESARAFHDEDRRACADMARHALPLVRDGGTYVTHCNAGALATGGIGTALGVFHLAAERGLRVKVYADETRPLLQGARLTAFELAQGGVEVVLQCDSAAASLLAGGAVEGVFVGADRIAANGDTANKIGTLPLAIAARHFGVPFYVVAPRTTFDPAAPDGLSIPIEERDSSEVAGAPGRRAAPEGVRARNPAFDVTPAALLSAIVTERGIIRPVREDTIRAILS